MVQIWCVDFGFSGEETVKFWNVIMWMNTHFTKEPPDNSIAKKLFTQTHTHPYPHPRMHRNKWVRQKWRSQTFDMTCVTVDQTKDWTSKRASERSKSQQFPLKWNTILELRHVCIGLHIKTCIIHGWDYFSLHRISATLRKMYNNPISQMVSWFLAYRRGLAK